MNFLKIIKGNKLRPYTPPKVTGLPPISRYGDANPYYVAPDFVNKHSVVYSIGIGNDFSFDEDMIAAFGVVTYAIDPTPQSLAVFNQIKNSNIHFLNCGIGSSDETKYFKVVKQKSNYMSAHLSEDGKKTDGVKFSIRSVPSLMKDLRHSHIDVFRIDAEGAEFNAIPHMFENNIYPTQVIFEIHPKLFSKIPGAADKLQDTNSLTELMENSGYSCTHVSPRGTEISWIRSYLL